MDAPPVLSDEWIEACNAALATVVALDSPTPHLVVTERIFDAAPGTPGAVTLIADDAGVRLVAGDDSRATAWLTLAMADVVALHTGALDPARALTEGKVRVRGDLRAVVEAASLLAVAHRALRDR